MSIIKPIDEDGDIQQQLFDIIGSSAGVEADADIISMSMHEFIGVWNHVVDEHDTWKRIVNIMEEKQRRHAYNQVHPVITELLRSKDKDLIGVMAYDTGGAVYWTFLNPDFNIKLRLTLTHE